MKGLTDLAAVAAAPNLVSLALTSANHLQPEVLAPFTNHPTLREAHIGFGSTRKNQRGHELLGL